MMLALVCAAYIRPCVLTEWSWKSFWNKRSESHSLDKLSYTKILWSEGISWLSCLRKQDSYTRCKTPEASKLACKCNRDRALNHYGILILCLASVVTSFHKSNFGFGLAIGKLWSIAGLWWLGSDIELRHMEKPNNSSGLATYSVQQENLVLYQCSSWRKSRVIKKLYIFTLSEWPCASLCLYLHWLHVNPTSPMAYGFWYSWAPFPVLSQSSTNGQQSWVQKNL